MIKRAIPVPMLNRVFLALPLLYRTKIVNYETNISTDGIGDLLSQLDHVLQLKGNIIECGSSRCGASVIMANYLRSRSIMKTIYACDSFQGFDRTELRRERANGLTQVPEEAFTSTSYEYVKFKLARLGVSEIVVPIKGFFSNTLPEIDSDFCFALIDCDLRDSIVYCAEALWPRLATGARILFDDYTDERFKAARHGIDHFVNSHKIEIEEHRMLKRLYMIKKA